MSDYNYTVIHIKLLRTGTATRKEQFARHEILRAQNRLRTRPQNDNVSFCRGFAPAPLFLQVRTQLLV